MNKFRYIETSRPYLPAVFLPGWGFDGRVVELAEHSGAWIYPLKPIQAATLVADLTAFLTDKDISSIHLAGWSMGAYAALDFAAANPRQIASLTLLAARTNWPPEEIEEIRSELLNNPAKFLEKFYRKSFMGYKAAYRRFKEQLQDDYLAEIDLDTLLSGLDYLQKFHVTNAYPKTTMIHGKRDLVAPIDQQLYLADSQQITVKHGGHPVFLDNEFAYPLPSRKEVIRRKFSRAAGSYDQHAQVQKELVNKLTEFAPVLPQAPHILEIGCGTGNYTGRLAKKYPTAKITALDFSQAMLNQAQKKLTARKNIDFNCLDAEEYLANTPGGFDLITSNATMQWFDNFAAAAHNIAAALQPDGILYASMFGPRTMEKIAQGLREVLGLGNITPSSTFLDQPALQRILARHFTSVHIEERIITRHYKSLHELLKYIQKTGTSGWQPSPPFFSRQRLKRLDQWFADKFNGYAITNQIFMITARHIPHEK